MWLNSARYNVFDVVKNFENADFDIDEMKIELMQYLGSTTNFIVKILCAEQYLGMYAVHTIYREFWLPTSLSFFKKFKFKTKINGL